MLETDGVHLKPVYRDQLLAHLRQTLTDFLALPAPVLPAPLIPLVDFANIESTVKPVYNDHPWDREKVVVVQRWSLFRGSKVKFYILIKKID